MTALASPPAAARTGTSVALTVIAGTVMIPLDVTVVAVALARLAEETGASLPVIQWVSTGYTLALASVIPLTGWAADRFGTKRLYMAALALFFRARPPALAAAPAVADVKAGVDAWQRAVLDPDLMKTVCAAPYVEGATSG